MGESAVPIALALSGVQAAASISGAQASKRAAEIEAQQYREEAENARVAAEQEEAQRRKELVRTLAAQEAIRAGRGVELFSGTGLAIRDSTIHEAETDINTARLNALNRIRRFNLGASVSEAKGQSALLGGIGAAAGTLSRAAEKLPK